MLARTLQRTKSFFCSNEKLLVKMGEAHGHTPEKEEAIASEGLSMAVKKLGNPISETYTELKVRANTLNKTSNSPQVPGFQ